jgi:hypothetical protein
MTSGTLAVSWRHKLKVRFVVHYLFFRHDEYFMGQRVVSFWQRTETSIFTLNVDIHFYLRHNHPLRLILRAPDGIIVI